MKEQLGRLYDDLELQRRKLFDSVSGLRTDQLIRPSIPGKWSVSEILSHLLTAERMSVQYIQKKVLGIEQAADSGLWEEFKMILFILSQRLPGLKFKAPKRVVENTRIINDLPTLKKEWDAVRIELNNLLRQIPDNRIKRKILKHVRVGYINIIHTLIFFREHMLHHTPQIRSQIRHTKV